MPLKSVDDVAEVFRQCLGEKDNLLHEPELFQKFVNNHSPLAIVVVSPEN